MFAVPTQKISVYPETNPEGKAFWSVSRGQWEIGMVTLFKEQYLVIVTGMPAPPNDLWATSLWEAVGMIVDAHEKHAAQTETKEAA